MFYEPADGGNSRSDPTCQILLSPLKSNSWRRLDCFVGLTLGEGKKTASESKATAHPTVSMNYLGSMTSIIQKVFFFFFPRPRPFFKLKTEAGLYISGKVQQRWE